MTSAATPTSSPPPASPSPPIHGRFLWHELLARDADAAKRFYPAVTGWASISVPYPGQDAVYMMFVNGQAGVAGIQPYPAEALAAGAMSAWLPYMGTDDTDDTCRKAVSLGATQLMAPYDIETVGRIAVLRDPQGAQFAVLTPSPAGMPETTPVVGEFAWHEMTADDPKASIAFYQRLFGWKLTHSMDMEKDGVYQMFGLSGFTYGGFMGRPASSAPTAWNCYIRVADLDASIEAVTRGGGRIMMGPHAVPNDDRIAVALDDQGTVFSLVSRTAG